MRLRSNMTLSPYQQSPAEFSTCQQQQVHWAHMRRSSLKRVITVKKNLIWEWLEQNLSARFYIGFNGLDLNISYCCVTLQLSKRSKCTKGSCSHAPNKLIICTEECVMKQDVKLNIGTVSNTEYDYYILTCDWRHICISFIQNTN